MGNETKVLQQKNEQFLTTIPRALAEAKGLKKGDKLKWEIEGSSLSIRKA